jgi:hypothetical protein
MNMGKRGYSVCCLHGCIPVGSDFNESKKVDIEVKDWPRQQLFMADGRLVNDKTWCFYSLNYDEPRRSMTQGQWFVKNLLHTKEITCTDSLKKSWKITTHI